MRVSRNGLRLIAALLLIWTLIFAFSGCAAFSVRPADTGETGTGNDATAPATTAQDEEKEPSAFVALLLANEEIPAFNRTVLENLHFYYSHYFIGELGTDEGCFFKHLLQCSL